MKKSPNVEGSGASLKTNRTLIGILCIIVALVLVFLISPLLQKSSGDTKDIIRLARDVARGDAIRAEDIEIVTVGSAGLPDNNPKIWLDPSYQKELLQGGENGGPMYARTDLYKGDYFNQDKLIESNYASVTAEDAFASELNGSKVAISFSARSYAQMLSGKLLNGDVISLIVSPEENPYDTGIILPEFRYVQVLTTTTEKGFDRDSVPRNEDGTIDGAVTVTVIVRREQAQLLAYLEDTSNVHCALVCRGTDPRAKNFLAEQDRWLEETFGPVDNLFEITGEATRGLNYIGDDSPSDFTTNVYNNDFNSNNDETVVNR